MSAQHESAAPDLHAGRLKLPHLLVRHKRDLRRSGFGSESAEKSRATFLWKFQADRLAADLEISLVGLAFFLGVAERCRPIAEDAAAEPIVSMTIQTAN